MLITLFTDASFCPDTHVASYAVWAKVDGIAFRYSGILKGHIPRSDVAELQAIANGIAFVFIKIKPPPGSRIIAQTDCLSAIHILQNGRALTKETEIVSKLLMERQIQIEYRHVQGHRGNATPRNAVNSWCDRECYRLLKIARERTKLL